MELLKALVNTAAVPGREQRMRDLILERAGTLFDETTTDNLGTLICRRKPRPKAGKGNSKKKPDATKILIACHIDQIGFLVRHIDDKGFLRLQAVGGFDTRNLFARMVTVCTESGDLPGVMNPSGKPTHIATDEEKKKVPEVHDFMVDMGLPADQVKQKVKIGDMVVLKAWFTEVGNTVVTQCLDNRVASWAIIRALESLEHHDCDIYVAFTAQEEVGCRGAGPAADQVKPDIAIALDTTLCVDIPGVGEEHRCTVQGDGAGLMVLDSTAIVDLQLLHDFERVAKDNDINVQRTMLPRGGTDASTIQRKGSGYRVMTIVCPTRYIHTITEMIHKDDLYAYRDLMRAYLAQA